MRAHQKTDPPLPKPPTPTLTPHTHNTHTHAHNTHYTAGGYAAYRFLEKGKAPHLAALDAAEAESKRREEERARPLTVRGVLASLGMKPEQVDRMMLASSLGGGGGGKVSEWAFGWLKGGVGMG